MKIALSRKARSAALPWAFVASFVLGFANPAFAQVTLCDPQLFSSSKFIDQNRSILVEYLTSLSKSPTHKILSGQWFGAHKSFDLVVKKLETETGRTPVIFGSHYTLIRPSTKPLVVPPTESAEQDRVLDHILEDHWAAGGLVALSWLADNPWHRLGTGPMCRKVPTPCAGGTLSELMRTDNPAGAYFHAELDQMAAHLAVLQDAGVVVLFRPFHEMNGSWFWWGARSATSPTPAEFSAFWAYVHDYFTVRKKLRNLLWVYSPGNAGPTPKFYPWGLKQPATYYYPGSNLVDIVAVDLYGDHLNPPTASESTERDHATIGSYRDLVALGKPLGLGELGPSHPRGGNFDFSAIIDELVKDYPRATFFLAWQDSPAQGKRFAIVSNAAPEELMNNPRVASCIVSTSIP